MCTCYVNKDGDVCVCGGIYTTFSFSKLFDKFTFSDGSPCEKEITE